MLFHEVITDLKSWGRVFQDPALFTPLARAFGLATLSPALCAAALALSLVPVAMMEVYKKFRSGS